MSSSKDDDIYHWNTPLWPVSPLQWSDSSTNTESTPPPAYIIPGANELHSEAALNLSSHKMPFCWAETVTCQDDMPPSQKSCGTILKPPPHGMTSYLWGEETRGKNLNDPHHRPNPWLISNLRFKGVDFKHFLKHSPLCTQKSSNNSSL